MGAFGNSDGGEKSIGDSSETECNICIGNIQNQQQLSSFAVIGRQRIARGTKNQIEIAGVRCSSFIQ